MKRKFNPNHFYIVDWAGNVTVQRKSYNSKAVAELKKRARERDTGKTLAVESGDDLNYEFSI